jgi:hypothetical protein
MGYEWYSSSRVRFDECMSQIVLFLIIYPSVHSREISVSFVTLTQVVIDESSSSFYTGYFDGQRTSWEILTAKYDTRPINLRSFFRTSLEAQNNGCSMACCERAGNTYFKVEPRTYVLDGGDMFVSWEGFYQDCSDEFASKRGLQWTIGISKIIQSTECVLTDGSHPVNFEDCTTPDTILFQGGMARQVMLGYSGVAVSRSPSGARVFYLSVVENKSGVVGTGAIVANRIWAIPEGENYSKNPNAAQQFGQIHISPEFVSNVVDDVGTIRLRLDEHGYPTALCRTGYDAGVFCYSVEIDGDGVLTVSNENRYVTQEQLEESCTIESPHYPITKLLPPVSTGLEVLWGKDSPGNMPDMLFFGCYGEVNGLGNFTTALADGTIHETINGGHPGTVLFGPDVAPPPEPMGDYIAPELAEMTSIKNVSNSTGSGSGQALPRGFFLFSLLLVVLPLTIYWKRRNHRGGYSHPYGILNNQCDLELSPDFRGTGSYVELA